METNKIIVDEKISNIIEKYQYEVNARKEIISFMLANSMDIHSKAFEDYQKEYTEMYVKYSEAKNQLEKEYVRPVYSNPQSWSLDFDTRELTVVC